MTMEDLNACAECGFTTTNINEFTQHIELHESEQQRASSGEISSPQEWNEDLDESLNHSPDCSPPSSLPLSLPLSPNSGTSTVNKPSKTVHSCPHCNFTTFMSQHMKSHLEAHERHQGQMYQCDICHMQFSQKANMHRHRMRHSGVKPYQCRYCLKKFFRKDQMQEHSMTHIKTGADFDCPVAMCDQQFTQHAGLRTHLDEAHTIAPSSPASCKRCSLLFANSRRLLLHYQTKHDEGDTSGIVVISSDSSKSENCNQNRIVMPATPPPQKRRRSTITSQNLMASSPEAHKTVKLDCVGGKTDPVSILADCEPVSSSMTTEDLLVSLSNANSQLPFDLSKAEAALQLWTRENNGSSEGAENQSHSPSVDSDTSGSTAVDPETGDKEPMICTHCGIMFSDPTLHLLHKGLHSALDPWTCNLCGHSCGDKYLFHAHMICFDHSCC